MPLGLGKGKSQAAVNDLWNESRALLRAAAMAKKPAAEHHRREERFECQGASEGLHHDHRLDRTAGRAAILFRKRQAKQPEHDEEERWNEPPIGPEWAGPIASTYFNTRKVSIYGGTNEIQKNIIAKAILGL